MPGGMCGTSGHGNYYPTHKFEVCPVLTRNRNLHGIRYHLDVMFTVLSFQIKYINRKSLNWFTRNSSQNIAIARRKLPMTINLAELVKTNKCIDQVPPVRHDRSQFPNLVARWRRHSYLAPPGGKFKQRRDNRA